MIRATQISPQHRWTQPPADTIVLDFDDRHRRRMAMTGTRGLEFLLDLENAVALRGGDALVLDDGRLIEVVAAPEPLLEIRVADPHHLVRVAWHLGNRHLPTQIVGKGLRIRRDHVIEAMVKGLGARVIEIEAPFDPEGGAYAGGGHGQLPNRVTTIMRIITARMIMRGMITHRTTMIMTTIMATIITMMSIASMSITTATPMLMTTNKPPPKPRRRATAAADIIAEAAANPAGASESMNGTEAAALYRLMTWLSPAFPVGAFSYSSGIEWAVEAGDIVDAASLRAWLAAMLADGPGFCDGVFLAQAHRAAASGDQAALRDLAELAAAFAPSRERHLETSAQGRAFIDIARTAWNCDGLDALISQLRRPDRLSGRGRHCQCRACDPAGAGDTCLLSCAGFELDLRRRAARSAGPDR